MRDKDLKYFSDFLKEFQSETDRGAALAGGALIEDRLERILRSHFLSVPESDDLLRGSLSPLGTSSSKIKCAYCLGLITNLEYSECEIIRRIRNEFAHKLHGLSFQDQKIKDLSKNLKANTPDGLRFNGNTRQIFINSVILTSLSLWYRPDYNKPFKAEIREWEYQL